MNLSISKILDKWENQGVDDLLSLIDNNLGALNEVSLINIVHAVVNFETFELNIMCVLQHAAANNSLEILKLGGLKQMTQVS